MCRKSENGCQMPMGVWAHGKTDDNSINYSINSIFEEKSGCNLLTVAIVICLNKALSCSNKNKIWFINSKQFCNRNDLNCNATFSKLWQWNKLSWLRFLWSAQRHKCRFLKQSTDNWNWSRFFHFQSKFFKFYAKYI